MKVGVYCMSSDFSDYENLLINLCEDYYLRNITITDLSQKYDLSRYKLLKYLEDAKEKKLVTISIANPYARNLELEKLFAEAFQTKVFILKESEDLTHRDLNFWRFAAADIQAMIDKARIVSLSWGDSVYKIIEQFSTKMNERLIFTQFIGEIGKYNSLAGSMRLVQKAANSYESDYLTLSAPLYILNDTARELFSLEPIIAKTLTTARHSDLLLAGVGTPSSINSVPAWSQHKRLLFGSLDRAVGFLYGRPFDSEGNFMTEEADKTFGLSIEEILAIPNRVGICNSKFKAQALLGALRGNFFTHLYLDEKSALKVLSLAKGDT